MWHDRHGASATVGSAETSASLACSELGWSVTSPQVKQSLSFFTPVLLKATFHPKAQNITSSVSVTWLVGTKSRW